MRRKDTKEKSLFLQSSSSILILLLFSVVPLFLENQYYNFLEAKTHAFLFVSAVFLFFILISFIVEKDKDIFDIKEGFRRKDLSVMLPLLFGTLSLFSSLLASFVPSMMKEGNFIKQFFSIFKMTFFGMKGWGMGSLEIGVLLFLYLYIRRNAVFTTWMLRIILFINIFIFTVAVFHYASIDLFKIHGVTASYVFYDYASTLGQKNVIAGYISLLFPLVLVRLLYPAKDEKKIDLILKLLFLAVSVFVILLCNSDSVYLNLLFSLIVFFPFAVKTKEDIVKMTGLFTFFGSAILLISLLPAFSLCIGVNLGPTGKMIHPLVGTGVTIVGAFLTFFFYPKKNSRVLRKSTKNILLITLEMVFILGILLFIVISIWQFNDDWGSKRGLIWRYTFLSYQNLPLYQKLFGAGPARVYKVFSELKYLHGQNVYSAHNEFLQVLLTVGPIGLLLFISSFASIIVPVVRTLYQTEKRNPNGSGNPQLLMFLLPLIAYLGHMTLNSSMIMNAAIFTCLAAFCKVKKEH